MMKSLNTIEKQSWLTWGLRLILFLGFLVLAARLFDLQIIKGAYFRALADGNRIRRVTILAPRGKILARGGEILVGNLQVQKAVKFDKKNGYTKSDDLTNASNDELIADPLRSYPLGASFAHLGGYLGEANADEVDKIDPQCLDKGPRKVGTYVGRDGLEQQYDCSLRGVDGEELIEVDSLGRKVRVIGRRVPISGDDIHTTIDFGLQSQVAHSMKDKKGSAVVTDGHGQVLALYSGPSYDPSDIAPSLNDQNLPLFNRAIGGAYHPGSIFKIVTATAALEDGKITKDFTYDDTGVIKINQFSYTNWFFTQYGKTEGNINLVRAIARSTDTFFYKVGEMVGVDRLYYWSRQFGLGDKTGIDLPGEIVGIVPNPDWKSKVKGEAWFLGNTYHMAIGQGDLTATPIAMNAETSVVASGGSLCKVHILGDISNFCKSLNIKRENLDIIKEGMTQVCSNGGTAFPFFDFKPQAACKTGTAETQEKDKTHAWFSAFAPVDNPQIVVTILVEKGGEGSVVAAPIAREIMSYWFSKPR